MVRFAWKFNNLVGTPGSRILQVLLFANGVISHGTMVQRVLDNVESPRIICADGGAIHARDFGLRPETIIGDLDSLSAEQVADFKSAGAEVIQFPPDKDETDLELALRHCVKIGADSIHILGGLGGRFDQTLANILLLALPALEDIQVEVVDGEQRISLLRPGARRIVGHAGDTISLIPLGSAAEGITTADLRYPLRDETLTPGPARGISNVMLADQAELAFSRGLLLLVHTIGRA